MKILRVMRKNAAGILRIILKYVAFLSDAEKERIQTSINSISSKYRSIISLKQQRYTRKHIDPMFFRFEVLPPFGKEYWFMKFVSTNPKDKHQLLTMFGRCMEGVEVNSKYVKPENISGKQSGYMSSWFYDEGKKMIVEDKCLISAAPGRIEAAKKNAKIKFTGKFPSYRLKVSEGNEEVCDLRIYKPKKYGRFYSFESFFKILAGFAKINIYLDFTGTLNGKKFNGGCYVQKVIVIGPLVPWYWGRIVFADGSVLKYYMPKIELFGVCHKLISRLEFYDSKTGKEYVFDGLRVEKRKRERFSQYFITDSKKRIRVSIEPYSSHTFLFKKVGTFEYVEYLGEVKEIHIADHRIDVNKLGRGIGLIEEAKKYVF
ncbi:hypothetical protein HY991_00340 [Candidatus Micrarchaeota archaeon]|nr:hypothetical protein [Candidatus Micrarchaeota archaeon]